MRRLVAVQHVLAFEMLQRRLSVAGVQQERYRPACQDVGPDCVIFGWCSLLDFGFSSRERQAYCHFHRAYGRGAFWERRFFCLVLAAESTSR